MKKTILCLALMISLGMNMQHGNIYAAAQEIKPVAIDTQVSDSGNVYMDRYAVLNIYDWDGATKLSSIAVPKGIGISEFLPNLDKPGYIHSGWTTVLREDGSKNIATPKNIRGSNKTPYDGEKYDIYSATKGNLDLMPVYDEGELGTGVKDRRYVISHSPLEVDPQTKDFVTTVTVKRPENTPRIHGNVKLRIDFNTLDCGTIRVYINLGNKDIETYRLIVPAHLQHNFFSDAISLTVIDGEFQSRSRPHNISSTERPAD